MNNLDHGCTDEMAADALKASHKTKSRRVDIHPAMGPKLANVLPGSPGSGAAPGANGPPTTGPYASGTVTPNGGLI